MDLAPRAKRRATDERGAQSLVQAVSGFVLGAVYANYLSLWRRRAPLAPMGRPLLP